MHNELFHIGSITIYGYGLMVGLGFLAAIISGILLGKKRNIDSDSIFSIAIVCIVSGLLGAKLLYFIIEMDSIIKNPLPILYYVTNGFVIYGGIIGGILGAYIYCKIKKVSFISYFDTLIPCVSIAQGFGRIGCLLAGCCFGKPTDSWLGITFHSSEIAPNDISLYPTQLFSIIGNFLLFALLVLMLRKKKFNGQIASAYLIFYGIGRFIIEFFRDDDRGTVGIFSTSQFISIFIVLTGILLFVFMYLKSKKKSSEIAADNIVPEYPTESESESEDIDSSEESGAKENALDNNTSNTLNTSNSLDDSE